MSLVHFQTLSTACLDRKDLLSWSETGNITISYLAREDTSELEKQRRKETSTPWEVVDRQEATWVGSGSFHVKSPRKTQAICFLDFLLEQSKVLVILVVKIFFW